MRITCAAIIAYALAAALAGCGSGDGGMGPPIGGQGVTVGNILFRSNHNGSKNPAIDTVAAGSALEWSWVSTGSVSHSVRSTGTPTFVSSAILTGNGTTYSISFTTPGVYRYDCEVHGAAMTGTVVVQ
ncbi:MAG: plastocyanin/azurin family copper-binding protein [Gemmatimonadota bacterium]|nr:plastocyanin/azurin family copper-binding protein [Gemmatimonadota bacterium]